MVSIIVLTPPQKNGGDVFFVKICIFELNLGPYFLSYIGFSHITIITATYARQSCALPPFWVTPFSVLTFKIGEFISLAEWIHVFDLM
jgi:hypothetical protein